MTHATRTLFVLSLLAIGATQCASGAPATPDDSPPAASTAIAVSSLAQRGCASCHDGARGGLSGSDTPVPGTRAFAPNLTPDPETGLGRWSDDQIVRAIREGLDDEGEPLCETMPRFGEMNDVEIGQIVADLRALAPVIHQTPETACGAQD
jgi:mono/diheme cytochrome c family protein